MDRAVTEKQGHNLASMWKAVFLEASAKQNEVTSKQVSQPLYLFYIYLGYLVH